MIPVFVYHVSCLFGFIYFMAYQPILSYLIPNIIILVVVQIFTKNIIVSYDKIFITQCININATRFIIISVFSSSLAFYGISTLFRSFLCFKFLTSSNI